MKTKFLLHICFTYMNDDNSAAVILTAAEYLMTTFQGWEMCGQL